MRPYKKFRFLILICLIFQLLSACAQNNKLPVNIGDGGLLSDQPCSAPCFWGITPGVSTAEQAMNILSKELGVKHCDRWDTRNDGGNRGMQCSDITIGLDNEDIVSVIGFSPAQDITVDDVIKKFGNPDGVFVTALGIEMQPPIAVALYFDGENMIIDLPEQNSISYNLQPNTLIDRIAYLEQSEYEYDKSSIQMWKGFGKY